MMLSFNIVLMIVCAIVLYKAGELENGPGLLWAALSLAMSFLTWQVMGWGLIAMIAGQVALLIGIGVVGALRDGKDKS